MSDGFKTVQMCSEVNKKSASVMASDLNPCKDSNNTESVGEVSTQNQFAKLQAMQQSLNLLILTKHNLVGKNTENLFIAL